MAWVKAQGVVDAGEDKVRIYMKKVEDTTSAVEFDYETDIVGELTDINGMGASRDSKEYNGYHYDEKVVVVGNSTPNEVSLTENLTVDENKKIRQHYKDKDMLAVGIFAVGTEKEELIYGYVGQISSWTNTIPNGDTTSIEYGMTVKTERDDLTVKTAE